MSLLVQSSGWSAQYSATGGTQTLSTAPTTGHRIVVRVILLNNFTPGTISAITDNQTGNTFYALRQQQDGESGDNCSAEMWTCDSVTYSGVSPYTIAVASPVTNSYNIIVDELLPCTVDQQGGAGTTTFPITATCANKNSYVPGIALAFTAVAYGATSVTDPPTGYTSQGVTAPVDGFTEGEACYRDLSAIEKSSATWTWVTGENGAAIIQTFAGLHPTITAEPQNETGAVGATPAFSVTATASGGSLSYQWYSAPYTSLYENVPGAWTAISGASSSSYTVPALMPINNGTWFYCAITDSNGTVNTNHVRLWVRGLPSAGKGLLLDSSWAREYHGRRWQHSPNMLKRVMNFGATDQAAFPIWARWFFGTTPITSASTAGSPSSGAGSLLAASSNLNAGAGAPSFGAGTLTGVGALIAHGWAPSAAAGSLQPVLAALVGAPSAALASLSPIVQAKGGAPSVGEAPLGGPLSGAAGGPSSSEAPLTGTAALAGAGGAPSGGEATLAGAGALTAGAGAPSAGEGNLSSSGSSNLSGDGGAPSSGEGLLTGAGVLTAKAAAPSAAEAPLGAIVALSGGAPSAALASLSPQTQGKGGAPSSGAAPLSSTGVGVSAGAPSAGAGPLGGPLASAGGAPSFGAALLTSTGAVALTGFGGAPSAGTALLTGLAALTARAGAPSSGRGLLIGIVPGSMTGFGGAPSAGAGALAGAMVEPIEIPSGVSPELPAIYATLRELLQTIIGGAPPVEVLVGIDNRVPMPRGAGFIIMTALGSYRLATNIDTDVDGWPFYSGTTQAQVSMRLEVRLDFYGPDSADWAVMVGTLFRDEFAADFLAPLCQPLYADNPRMVALIAGEEQYIEHWILQSSVQYDPVTVTAQSFATTLAIEPLNVDVEIPPQ